MLNMLKNYAFVGVLFLMALCSRAYGNDIYECDECCEPQPYYIGFFGGAGRACDADVSQKGTVFFPPGAGGPLDVNATGSLRSHSVAIGGVNLGYKLQQVNDPFIGACITPAVEFEAYYLTRLGNTQTGHLINTNDRLPEHDFINSLPMDCGVFLANGVFSFDVPCLDYFQPYVGVGVGATKIWISDAKSRQVDPSEPGINHFNSRRHDSDWTFAVQAKAGLRCNIFCNWQLFAEYRFLHLNSTSYKFGDTRYPEHFPTTDWRLHLKGLNYNMVIVGLQYSL